MATTRIAACMLLALALAAHQASAQNSTANSTTSASNTTSATNTTSNVTSTATQAAATSPTTTSTTSAAGIPACPNFLAGLKALKGYTTVLKAIEATKLTAQFSDPSYVITAFLPDDTAFSGTAKKFGLSVDQVLAQTSLLSQILKYHLVKGTYTSKDLKNGQVLTPLEQGPSKATLTINNVGATSFVVQAVGSKGTVKAPLWNIACGKGGVVHAIDTVLLPIAI
eukprot:jgi/Chrzof1/12085/Cz06g20240.t1